MRDHDIVDEQVLVAGVLDQVAVGMAWETSIDGWHGSISKAAIREAVQLAGQALLRDAYEFALEPVRVCRIGASLLVI